VIDKNTNFLRCQRRYYFDTLLFLFLFFLVTLTLLLLSLELYKTNYLSLLNLFWLQTVVKLMLPVQIFFALKGSSNLN